MATEKRAAPDISVVIPTRARPERLAECLAALNEQQIAEPFEVVVVADGDDEIASTADVVQQFACARLLRQPKRGPAAARNLGAASARGSLVCFTDDDCRPTATWLSAMTQSLRRGALVAVGTTFSRRASSQFAAASELIALYFTRQSAVAFAATNNVACQAAVLRSVPFDERYDGPAGEDREWCAELARRGIALTPVPDALVLHDLRVSLREFLAQQMRYGRAAYLYHRGFGTRRRFERPRFYLWLLRDAAGRGLTAAVLAVLGQLAISVGFASEAARSLLRRRG